MSAILTRNLQVYALTRQQSIDVALIYRTRTKNNNGSYSSTETVVETKGFLTALTDYEIKRLNESGVTIARGTKLSLNSELTSKPFEVQYNKTDEYTFKFKANVISYNISEGVTVLTLDTEPLLKNN